MENLKESKNVAKATDVKKEVKTTGHRDPDIERASRTVERYVDSFSDTGHQVNCSDKMATEMKSREYRLTATTNEMPVSKITDSRSAAEYVRRFYQDDIAIYESAFILMLDKAMNTIGWAKISQGGICGTVVDIRIVAKYAVDALASGVIFVHNHPSGQLFPSPQDDKLTSRLKDGLALLDIKLADSIIIIPENGRFYSFRDGGKL